MHIFLPILRTYGANTLPLSKNSPEKVWAFAENSPEKVLAFDKNSPEKVLAFDKNSPEKVCYNILNGDKQRIEKSTTTTPKGCNTIGRGVIP
ncbi:MAG: hypothetical protein J6T98_10690 [Salinivirgaceae bacterium]|nr:hypothetical protein [Salinivirgaceae bacterium]